MRVKVVTGDEGEGWVVGVANWYEKFGKERENERERESSRVWCALAGNNGSWC